MPEIPIISMRDEFEHLLWARLLIAQKEADAALQLLGRLLQGAEAGGRTGRVIEILALQALAQQALGDSKQALIALRQALSLAEPQGYVRLFVDEGTRMQTLLQMAATRKISPVYIDNLLAAFAVQHDDPGPAEETKTRDRSVATSPSSSALGRSQSLSRDEAETPVEALSNRELEVLRLIAAGLTNRQIAQELTIAVSTVKTHVKNIHAKLRVQNRTQAVARARELHLLQ